MTCIRCGREILEGMIFCPYCGKKQIKQPDTRHQGRRGNGEGSVYKRPGQSTWSVRITIGRESVEGKTKYIRLNRGGFETKKDALAFIEENRRKNAKRVPETLDKLYEAWAPWYEPRVGKSTMAGYKAAYNHLRQLGTMRVDQITASDLQRCIDGCEAGKRTKQMIKVTASLLMKKAMDDNLILKNPAENLYTGDGVIRQREPLTDDEVAMIESSGLEYADYVVAMCYLGHRPSEFFAIQKSDVHLDGEVNYIVGGIKTDAGIDRAVTIPPRILPIIKHRMSVIGTDYLFPRAQTDRRGKFTGWIQMTEAYWREWIFKPMMAKLGIEGKLPYGTRHTYSNKIGDALGAEKDKAALMGHADYSTTKKHYQSSDLDHKKKITDQMA